jgi:hypothetical protein
MGGVGFGFGFIDYRCDEHVLCLEQFEIPN